MPTLVNKKQIDGKSQQRQMKKVNNFSSFYIINSKYFDILGNGAFGTVRPCRRAKHYNDSYELNETNRFKKSFLSTKSSIDYE